MSSPPHHPHDPLQRSPLEADPLMGRVLGERYRIETLIARGGMARVFRAHDLRLDRDVALKVLSSPYSESADFTRRFLAEARTAASLSHPNLAHVYDSGVSDGMQYMVMELLVGYRSLHVVLGERGRLPVTEAVSIAQEVLAGLAVVHDHGLVHADVKAANVMVGPGPTKLIDFGIAHGPRVVSEDGTSLGSLHAMSPEQLRGDELRAESDLFALGVVLYQALTGSVPYPGDDPAQVLARQEAGRPSPPSSIAAGASERLDHVVLQALDPERGLRFNTAAAMSHALRIATAEAAESQRAIAADETTRIVSVPRRARRRPRRPVPGVASRGVPLLLLVVLAVLVAVVVLGVSGRFDGIAVPGGRGSSAAPTATPTAPLPPGKIRVPNTIGLSEQAAEAEARASGLRWEIRWQEAAGQPPGIYDQEPKAGLVVDRGSRFTMYAYRQPN